MSKKSLSQKTSLNHKPVGSVSKIIESVQKCLKKGGKFIFLTSSLVNYKKLIEQSKNLGLRLKIVARKKLFFEELILVECKK